MPEEPPAPVCPFCTADRDIERRGAEWFCPVCSRCWLAYTDADAQFLRVNKIKPELKES